MASDGSYSEDVNSGCLSCRLIRGLGCLGIGSYLINQGKHMKGYDRGTLLIFGGCFGVLGLASLLGFNLFNKSKLS